MVHFEPNDQDSARGTKIAPVAYLPGAFGAAPGGSDGTAAPDSDDATEVTARRSASGTVRRVARLADRRGVFPSAMTEDSGTGTGTGMGADSGAGADVTWAARTTAHSDLGNAADVDFDDATDSDLEDSDEEEADEEEAEFDPVAEREHAESLLLARLRSRSLSVVEASAVLAATEVSEEDIDDILTRFTELNYLDDNKLADQIIHTHHAQIGRAHV